MENHQVLADQSMPPQPNPWERKPDEPTRWYDRFVQFYLPLGTTRSILRAYRLYTQSLEDGQSKSDKYAPSPWYDHSKTWHWSNRADAYDNHQLQIFLGDLDSIKQRAKRERVETLMLLLKKAKRGLELKEDESLVKEPTAALSQATKTSARELREELDGYGTRSTVDVNIILAKLQPELQKLLQSALKPSK